MGADQAQIFWGTLTQNDCGNPLFSPPEGVFEPDRFPVMVVDAFSTNLAVEEFVIEIQNQLTQQVSILGQLAVDDPEVGGDEAIIAHSVALHNDIAVRAFTGLGTTRGFICAADGTFHKLRSTYRLSEYLSHHHQPPHVTEISPSRGQQ